MDTGPETSPEPLTETQEAAVRLFWVLGRQDLLDNDLKVSYTKKNGEEIEFAPIDFLDPAICGDHALNAVYGFLGQPVQDADNVAAMEWYVNGFCGEAPEESVA